MLLRCNWSQLFMVLTIPRRVYRSRRFKVLAAMFAASLCLVSFYIVVKHPYLKYQLLGGRFADFEELNEAAHAQIKETVLKEKGTGCKLPELELYSEEAMAFIKDIKDTDKIVCEGEDWVKCYKSECFVVENILRSMKNVLCTYSDLLYVDDDTYHIGDPLTLAGSDKYVLNRSDNVKICCTATDRKGLGLLSTRWYGYKAGFRPIHLNPRPPERKDTYNVMILIFDSASHNGFIRRMPKSYKYLNEDLNAVILNSYSIVGEGTPGNLFPVLSGKTVIELPDARKKVGIAPYVDHTAFIFHHLKEDGYRTAFFEDSPWIGTFQLKYKGFKQQPADHYLRPLFMEESRDWKRLWNKVKQPHCMGATPYHQFLMNLSNEFLDHEGKKFCLTVLSLAHDDFNLISNADDATVDFIKALVDKQVLEDTLVIVMADHGSRSGDIRNTYQGRLEERLPLMAIMLPEKMKKLRPSALEALKHNKDVLTTHFDLHATLLDVVDLKQHTNPYKEPGADIPRSMTLLEKIPNTRTCGEAGVIPHWCVCTSWYNVSQSDPKYEQAAIVLADYINKISDEKRDKCAKRKLISTVWVMRQGLYESLKQFPLDVRHERYFGSLRTPRPNAPNEYYQAKIIMSPGKAVFEGTLVYNVKWDYFYINEQDISRTSAYGDEPACVSATHPHLNKFCYCKDKLTRTASKAL